MDCSRKYNVLETSTNIRYHRHYSIFTYLKNFVKVLHCFDALENSNSFRFLILSLLGMFSFNRLFFRDFLLCCTRINFILSWIKIHKMIMLIWRPPVRTGEQVTCYSSLMLYEYIRNNIHELCCFYFCECLIFVFELRKCVLYESSLWSMFSWFLIVQ